MPLKYHLEHVDLTLFGDFQLPVVIRINYAQLPSLARGALR